jgi:hypothetical protein
MLRKVTWLAAMAGALMTVPVSAQDKRVEASVLVGWTFSDGVDVGSNPAVVTPEGIYDRVDPKDSFKWGLTGSVHANESLEIGFQYGQQNTQLEASGPAGTPDREIGDISIRTYHGFFGFNFLDEGSPVRPYFMFGLGATQYGSVDFTRFNGEPGSVSGETQFSTTWGAGVKIFPNPSFGIRAGVQWTPTYIKTDAGGWWCDPWWGCYVVGDSQYSSQWDLSGGVDFRF